MIKIEAVTLEEAYKNAAATLNCSVTEIIVEVVQVPNSGFLGLFKKPAIIVATRDKKKASSPVEEIKPFVEETKPPVKKEKVSKEAKIEKAEKAEKEEEYTSHSILNDTIMPTSFVSDQDEEDLEEDLASGLDYTADYDDEYDDGY